MFTQHYFIEGRYLGSSQSPGVFVHAEHCAPASYWFLCPCCGELWAKVATESPRQTWMPVITSCRKCGGGSIWRPWDEPYTEALPLAVLKWDFLRELEKQGLNHG